MSDSRFAAARGRRSESVPKPERQVLICLNERPPESPKGCCSAKGAAAVFARMKALVAEKGLAGRVMVTKTGCLKHCSRGVSVAVQPDNVWYAGVRESDLVEICDAHLAEGRPVERLLMPDIPWE
jgi:(2Fe-2S) ferredoxin